jgi:IS30 family transposase
VFNFIDDIVICSKNRDEHAEHVRAVINRLTAANLIINRNKCNFYSTQISLLGFVIGLHGKSVDPKKFVNIDEWEAPTTAKQVQSCLGTFNFFREYIPIFSTVAAPLDALRNRTEPFTLNEEQMRAFNTLKQLLTHAPILSFPDFNLPFYVATDASDVGIGAVLYQLPRGKEYPKDIRYISFMARSLQARERKYSATKKELLAIVFALNKFHYYLWGRHFDLYTDHRALTFLHSQQNLNPMMTTWQDTILNYSFDIHYRPGILNVLPDALSRLFPAKTNRPQPTQEDRIKLAYMHVIQNEETERMTVPEEERQDLLYHTHAMGHIGTNAMVQAIHQQGKTFPHLAKECSDFIKRCRSCQRNNIVRKGYHPMKAIHARLPGEHIAIDLAGPFTTSQDGNVYLLVIVDICTRFVLLDALPDKTAFTVAKTLFKRFSDIGFPRILQSDNGKEFLNGVMKQMTTKMHIDHRLITPYHPRGNGVAENHVKSACSMIRKMVADKADLWDKYVPLVQLSMNTRMVHLHNSSPFSLFFARQANGFSNYMDDKGDVMSQEDLLQRLTYMTEIVFPAIEEKAKATQAKMIERFNATVLHNEFPDGAKVMTLDPIRGDKLTARYEGPYTVVEKTPHGAYVLRDGTGELLHRNYAPSQLKLVLDDLETNTFEVEKIVGHKINDRAPGEYLYHVKWKGYPSEDNTWEPEDSFVERRCIRDYWQEHEEQQPRANLRRGVKRTSSAMSNPSSLPNHKRRK